jgi:hypothetical protein
MMAVRSLSLAVMVPVLLASVVQSPSQVVVLAKEPQLLLAVESISLVARVVTPPATVVQSPLLVVRQTCPRPQMRVVRSVLHPVLVKAPEMVAYSPSRLVQAVRLVMVVQLLLQLVPHLPQVTAVLSLFRLVL